MTEFPADTRALQRAAARARLRDAEADCLQLHRLLPGRVGWWGPASRAFGLRVDELRERIDAASAALAAAEREL
jgi:hypothetical protein